MALIEKTRNLEEKVLFFLESENLVDGLDLFRKSYNSQNPPPKNFFLQFLNSLRKLKADESAFQIVQEAKSWFTIDQEFEQIVESVYRDYYETLVEKGKALFESAHHRSKEFSDTSFYKIDVPAREKLEEENRNVLRTLYKNSMTVFEQAQAMFPSGLGAMNGIFHCLIILGETDKAHQVEAQILELTKGTQQKFFEGSPHEKSTEFRVAPPIEQEPAIDLSTLKRWFEQKRYEDALKGLKNLVKKHPNSVAAFILGAKCHMELNEYRPALHFLEKALRIDPFHEEAAQCKLDFLEKKFIALTRAGKAYLQKGIQLGPSMGNLFFIKAAHCLQQALSISPDEPELLDQLYSALINLREEKQADTIRQTLYKVSPHFITSWEKSKEQAACFIACFAYKESPECINDFRYFRQHFLYPSPLGKAFCEGYHHLSPLLIKNLEAIHFPRVVVFLLLEPVRFLIRFFNLFFSGNTTSKNE